MKRTVKLSLFVTLIVLIAVLVSAVMTTAYADEVEVESVEVVELESTDKPQEETEIESSRGVTESEIKEILDTYLTETQKTQAEKTASILAEKFGLNESNAYFIALAIVLFFGLVFAFVGVLIAGKVKNGKTNEKLNALSALLSDKDEAYQKLLNFVSLLDKETLEKLISEQINKVVKGEEDNIVSELAGKLGFDSSALKKVIGDTAVLTVQTGKIMQALRILAVDAKQTAMANVLSDTPSSTDYDNIVYENSKLKIALGEEKVKKVLYEEKAD